MDIPVLHDDQHGTAIVFLAGLINSIDIQGKKVDEVKVVMNGAGSAGQAVMKFMLNYGFNPENCIMCDTKGVIYKGRKNGMNPYKMRFQTNDD